MLRDCRGRCWTDSQSAGSGFETQGAHHLNCQIKRLSRGLTELTQRSHAIRLRCLRTRTEMAVDARGPSGRKRKQVAMRFSLGRRQLATVALVVGAAIGGAGIAAAATGTTTPTNPPTSTPAGSATAPTGGAVDHSNEDPAHEATETPEREAAETAGHMGGGGVHHSNTDPAHEAAESPERAAQEAANDAALGAGSTTPAAGSTTGG